MRDSRYSLRTGGGSTNTMQEITLSQVGKACYCIWYLFISYGSYYNALSHVSSLPAVGLNQFSDMTFGEFQKSFLWSEPQVNATHSGSLFYFGRASS